MLLYTYSKKYLKVKLISQYNKVLLIVICILKVIALQNMQFV